MKDPAIISIGTAVPPNRISQSSHYAILESANGMSREEKLALKIIYNRSGIEHRHSVLEEFSHEDRADNEVFHPSGNYAAATVSKRMEIYERHATQLCLQAAQDCFEHAPHIPLRDITHLISFSCTGMFAPGLDIELVNQLQLEHSVERTCINFMGCYAAINALKTAYHIVRSEPDAVVMLAGVELCSLHYQKSNEPNQVVANALFGDGASVVLVASQDRIAKDSIGFGLKTFYSEFEGSAGNDMVWRIGNEGFDLRLTPEVPNVVKHNIAALLQKLFEKSQIKKEDVDYYAIHPGGVKILEACEQALGISKDDNVFSYNILKEYGNMSSVTILFVLKAYFKQLTKADVGKKLLSCAFGPGITMESMIIETC